MTEQAQIALVTGLVGLLGPILGPLINRCFDRFETREEENRKREEKMSLLLKQMGDATLDAILTVETIAANYAGLAKCAYRSDLDKLSTALDGLDKAIDEIIWAGLLGASASTVTNLRIDLRRAIRLLTLCGPRTSRQMENDSEHRAKDKFSVELDLVIAAGKTCQAIQEAIVADLSCLNAKPRARRRAKDVARRP